MERVAAVVRERAGLVFPELRRADVEAAVRRAMMKRGIGDAAGLVPLLEDDAATRDALVAELTVGESYFQRDPNQFAFLGEHVIPRLLASRPPDRPVRVWSAGCAAGEEPYSVAMLFDELGAGARAQVVGTDISRPRLADAQRGVYSEWALRSTPADVRDRYFRQRGRFFELSARIRSRVDFRYLNLAEDRFPSLSAGIWGMDVILCRNVLIYFDAATVRDVARRLIASLSTDGWLILGASDPAIGELVECDVVMTDGGLVYRRPGAAGRTDLRTAHGLAGPPGPDLPRPRQASGPGTVPGDAVPAAPAVADRVTALENEPAAHAHADAGHHLGTDPEASTDLTDPPIAAPGATSADSIARDAEDAPVLEAFARRDFDAVCALAEARSHDGMGAAAWVAWLRALANRGQLEEARRVADRAVAAHGATAELLYLMAVLLLQSGRPAEATVAARRALYLDRELVVAHITLAAARQRAGDRPGARRALRNAATLLRRQPPESVVPASDGESAGRLAELVNVKLRLLIDADAA
jgi:chemotaxis protein methyltransferase CheR